MAIVDIELFNKLAPRSRQKILCRCDNCHKEIMVVKGNLYRYRGEDGQNKFYRKGEEPSSFTPYYEYCNSCERKINPANLGKPRSLECRQKISQKLTGVKVGCRLTEEGRRKVSESKKGEKNPCWNPDRRMVHISNKVRKKAGNLIWNCLKKNKTKDDEKSMIVRGYTQAQLIKHIESQFVEGMDWGIIDIDHIIPLRAFIDNNMVDFRVINDLRNLRPLFKADNLKKGESYNQEDFEAYIGLFDPSEINPTPLDSL